MIEDDHDHENQYEYQYHRDTGSKNFSIENHSQLKWDVCEQCATKQSRARERIDRGFHWRYPQVIIIMMIKSCQ